MSRRLQLLTIALSALAIASAVSHLVARAGGFRTEAVEPLSFGPLELPPNATAAGSSLTFYGINWGNVSRAIGSRIRGWAVPGGSVEEMEVLQRAAPSARCTFLGISPHDLNNNYLSEFHANLVPFWESWSKLRSSGTDWAFQKKVLSQYPLSYLRVLFPTAGRSTHVMVAIRERLHSLRPRSAVAPSERAVVSSDSNSHQESITEWPADRRQRKLGELQNDETSVFDFRGPKREAFFQLLDRGAEQGKMIVVVLPESPMLRHEIVTADVSNRFEALLADARRHTPAAIWVRLDTGPELNSNDYYWDLVHLNAPGQAIATEMLIKQLQAVGVSK